MRFTTTTPAGNSIRRCTRNAVAANLTYDGTEGRWKALQASGIYERRAYLTEVYRNSLAREVRLLGYEVETHVDAKGRDCGFEIGGVSNELLAKYSQRSQQRDKAIADFVKNKGRAPTDNEVSVLVRESRADKLIEISTPEVRRRQRARLTGKEGRQLEDLVRSNSVSAILVDSLHLLSSMPKRGSLSGSPLPAITTF